MNDYSSAGAGTLQLLLLLPFLVVGILFLVSQQKALSLIRPENRKMPPGQVWLQMIPLFGLVWQFIVITRISDSIRSELNSPVGDSIFSEDSIPSGERPTYQLGIAYATLFCVGVLPLPLVQGLASLAGLVVWIVYWVELAKYTKKLRQRALTAGF
jgi:hypothetical protein